MSSPNAAASPTRRPSRLIAIAMLATPPGADPSPSVTNSVPGGGNPASPVKIMSMNTRPERKVSNASGPAGPAPSPAARPARSRRRTASRSPHGSSSDGFGGSPTSAALLMPSMPSAMAPLSQSSQKGLALTTVRRHGSGQPVALHQVQGAETLAQLTGLGVPEPDAVAQGERVGGPAEQRGLHLAGPLGRVVRKPGGQVRLRQAAVVRAARGQVTAAEAGHNAGPGAPDDGEREQRGGSPGEAGVVVEQRRVVEPRAGGHLGDRVLHRRLVHAAGAAAVDELKVGLDVPDRVHHLGAPPGQFGPRPGLYEADRARPHGPARRVVADAGDLRLVRHDPGQHEAGPADDLLGQRGGLLGGVHGRAAGGGGPPAAAPPARGGGGGGGPE